MSIPFFCRIFARFFMKKASPYIAVVVAMLIWAGSGIAVKAALESFAPLALVLTRFTVGIVLMLVLGLVANKFASAGYFC